MQSEHKLALLLGALMLCALPESSHAEETKLFNLLDNGGFEEEVPGLKSKDGIVRIPWWKSSNGASMIKGEAGARTLVTPSGGGGWVSQPIAAFAPLVGEFVVRGKVKGCGYVTLVDGSGKRAQIEVFSEGDSFVPFELTATQFEEVLEAPLVPRFELVLESLMEAEWDDIEAWVALPLPTPAELRAEIVTELDWIFSLWLEHCLDDVGPQKPSPACHLIDVVTGERLATGAAGLHPLTTLMREAAVVEENTEWREAVDRNIADLLERCLHPVTGLPRSWDVERDVGRDGPVEIHLMLEFLIDVIREGPINHRMRSLEAAILMGRNVLAQGVLPDGNVAASYYPETGKPNTEVSVLRRLDVPAQLARLGAITEKHQMARAAREACVTLDFTNFWPGTWDSIDPGWDDNYGHYGRRATDMWMAYPEDQVFRGLSYGGALHYHKMWRNALRLGGNVAADQVRCWLTLVDIAQVAPETKGEIRDLLGLAARSHFKGEQYGNGAWGDVTIFNFDPKGNLNVGDLPGTPRNLLHGLAGIYRDDLDLRSDELRAMFTAVLRSSRTHYRREFGYLTTRAALAGQNWGGGEIRLAVGLVEMLKQLSD